MRCEEDALAIYRQVLGILKPKQATVTFWKFNFTLGSPKHADKKSSKFISAIEQIASQEEMHIMLLKNVFEELGITGSES